jgi:hypothetical protein
MYDGAKLREVSAELRIDFADDDDAIAMLATFVSVTAPVLERFGYTLEEKHKNGARDWAHWNRDADNLIRAYAFRNSDRSGVRIIGQGEIPNDLEAAILQRVAESTDWEVISPS